MTLADAVDVWVSELKMQGVSNAWANRCRLYVQEAAKACGGGELDTFTREAVLRWVEALRAEHKGRTIANRMTAVRQFGAWLHATGRLPLDPTGNLRVRCEMAGEGVRAFESPEVARLITAAHAHATERSTPLWYVPHLVTVAAYTALRWAEMGGLRRSDLHLDAPEPVLIVPPHVSKNRVRQLVPIHRAALPMLEHLAANAKSRDATLIPKLPEPRILDRLMEPAAVAKHDPRGRSASWHSFRKWVASELARRAVDGRVVSRLLRHGDESVADLRYTDFTTAELAEAMNRLPAPEEIDAKADFSSPQGEDDLTRAHEIADTHDADSAMNTTPHITTADESPRTDAGRIQHLPLVAQGGLATGRMSPAFARAEMTPRGFEPMGSGSENAAVNAALDRILDLAVRELRAIRSGHNSGAEHEHRSPHGQAR